MQIDLAQIIPNPQQPRTVFPEDEIQALANSMQDVGLLNPIAVEGPLEGRWYVLIDGECRYRAAKKLNWQTIEANVRQPGSDPNNLLIMAMIANLRRSNMGPVDEARAYERLRKNFSVADLAERLGYSQSHINGRIKLLASGLAEEVLDLLNAKRIPYDLGAIASLARLNEEDQIRIARRAASLGATVGALRGMCAKAFNSTPLNARPRRQASAHTNSKPSSTIAPALAVYAVDGLPEQYGMVVEKTIGICDRCEMYEIKNGSICRECALAKLMVELSKEGGHGGS